jgi:mono/diheme cytochrome c family protein
MVVPSLSSPFVRAKGLALALLVLARTAGAQQGEQQGERDKVAPPPAAVDFAREIEPILKGACLTCHGSEKQRGGLRLDSRAAVLAGGEGGPALVPGDAEHSELLRRVRLPREDDDAMPAKGTRLHEREVALLARWIEQGAPWAEPGSAARHWAYVRPERPPAPAPEARDGARDWPRNALDAFVLARLEREGLRPAPEAEPEALVRRLYLDLVGLPPTPAEVDAFLQDREPGAYERLVERLLASPQFGVRWARPWLDAARYSDSHGFQVDDLRELWAYRDWVVDALNADMPFDRFTVEQLAGDLLPQPTMAQRIATGFNRAAPCNVELGSDPAETRVNQVIDRVNTVATVWLGSTLECAQCHDHKYDPFTQREYYGLFSFFDQSAIEAERANPSAPGSIQFLGPYLTLPDAEADAARAAVEARRAEVAERMAARRAELARPDEAFEAGLRARVATAPREHRLRIEELTARGGGAFESLADGSVLASGEVPDKETYTVTLTTELQDIRAFKLEALTDPSLPGNGPGRGLARRPVFQLHAFELEVAPASEPEAFRPVAFARAWASFAQPKNDVANAIDGDPRTAWGIGLQVHRPHWAVFECAEPVGFPAGTRLRFRLVQDFGNGAVIGRLRLAAEVGASGPEGLPVEVSAALARAPAERSAAEREALVAYRTEHDEGFGELREQDLRLQVEIQELDPPTTLVMQEDTPRETHVFLRGDFRSPGELVEPGVPAFLPPLEPRERARALEAAAGDAPAGDALQRADRLDLARWLVRPDNPLVARVTVNRWWAELFGQGLVPTPEDFGVRGEPPSHPELLDWLAVELVENGWSMKRLLSTIVLSATYRQSARIPAELLARDPANRLLARAPRFRMEAERVHDNALAIAGLLDLKQGGPPIYPPQVPGLWAKIGGKLYEYEVSPGSEKYRRGLYVVWKRSSPYPSFVNFDAGGRLTCSVRRARSNTALQALTMLNDPVYVQAAAAFARRLLAERPEASPEERIEHAFRLALARRPAPAERAALWELYQAQRSSGDAARARQFAAAHEGPADVDAREFTAWYAVAAALLNLDETLSK